MSATQACLAADHQAKSNPAFVSLFGIGLVFVWVAWTTFWDPGLYGDNVEQFVWVHSLEWGYHKHPPMPTWLLGAAIHLIGPHSWLTNALAAICFAVTGWLTWLIARNLCGERIANTAIVLWTLQQCFSLSAQIYNHNTVLVMFVAATVYAVLRAKVTKIPILWWFCAGFFAGCALLSKYQAALPLFFVLVAVCVTNRQPIRLLLTGLATASVGLAIVFSPHFYWAVTNNFPALRYASAALESGGLTQRIAWVATFFVNQIRMVLPLLMVIGLCWGIHKLRNKSKAERISTGKMSGAAEYQRIWMLALVWTPVLLLVVTSLISGSQLRNHWGVQLFQFLPVWIAWRWQGSHALRFAILIPATLAVHAVGFTYYALKQSAANAVQSERRADSAYPARQMADAALAHWQLQTSCPLKIVAGDFEAGMASAFMKEFPVVYSGAQATPWVQQKHIRESGLLYILDMNTALPPDATAVKKWFLSSRTPSGGKYVQFAVKLPTDSCSQTS